MRRKPSGKRIHEFQFEESIPTNPSSRKSHEYTGRQQTSKTTSRNSDWKRTFRPFNPEIDCSFFGGRSADVIKGGLGDDFLFGLQGDDTLDGDDGLDRLFGGVDSDTLVWHQTKRQIVWRFWPRSIRQVVADRRFRKPPRHALFPGG